MRLAVSSSASCALRSMRSVKSYTELSVFSFEMNKSKVPVAVTWTLPQSSRKETWPKQNVQQCTQAHTHSSMDPFLFHRLFVEVEWNICRANNFGMACSCHAPSSQTKGITSAHRQRRCARRRRAAAWMPCETAATWLMTCQLRSSKDLNELTKDSRTVEHSQGCSRCSHF